MPSNITPPRVRLVDPETGIVSHEWYKFFLSLFNLVGAGVSTGVPFTKVAALPTASLTTQGVGYLVLGVGGQPDAGYIGVMIGDGSYTFQQLF